MSSTKDYTSPQQPGTAVPSDISAKQHGAITLGSGSGNTLQKQGSESERQAAIARTEMVQRIADGQPPSKEDFLVGLDVAANKLQEAQQYASQINKKEGEKTLRDARQVLEATKALAEDANRSGLAEKTQQLVIESYKAAQAAAEAAKGELENKGGKLAALKPSGEETQQMRSAAERLLSVLKMIVTSSDGRDIMMELSDLLKRIFHEMGDTLEEVTDTVTQAGVEAAQKVHEASTTGGSETKEGKEERIEGGESSTTGGGGATTEKKDTTAADKAEKKRQKKRRQKLRRQERKLAEAGQTAEGLGDKLKKKWEQKKCELCDTKDQAEQTKERVMTLMGKIVDHAEVRQAVQDIVWIVRDYSSRIKTEGKDVAQSVAEAAKSSAEPHAARVAELAEEVLRELAPGEILDQIAQTAKDIINTFANNQPLKQFWGNLEEWFNDILDNPEQFKNNREKAQEKLNELIQDGKETWHEVNAEVGPKMHDMSDLLEELFDTLKNDAKLQELQESVKRLQADLFTTDSSGKPHLRMEAVNDLKSIIAPMIANALRYIALPRIEYSDASHDFVATDVVLRSDELLPDAVKFYAEAMFNVQMKDMSSSHEVGRFSIFIRGVKVEAKNFKFYLNRKTFPSIKDEGTCSIVTAGKGVDIDISFREQSAHPFLSAPQARVRIDKLDITFNKDAEHRLFLNFLTTIFRVRIEMAIEDGVQKVLEQNGLSLAEKINSQLYHWQASMPSSGSSRPAPAFDTAAKGAPPIPDVPKPLEADKDKDKPQQPPQPIKRKVARACCSMSSD